MRFKPLLVILLASATGTSNTTFRTAAPAAVNLSGSSASEGTSPAFARADHVHAITGTLADASLSSSYSGVGSCGANLVATATSRNAPPTCAQPAFSWLSGSATAAQIPSLDASAIGTGIFAAARIPSLDASAIGTGLLPQARGGTGAGVLNCGAAGNFVTSNGTAYSCAAQTVTGPLMVAQFTLSGATTTVTGMPASGMVCTCSDVSASNTLCKAPTSGTTLTITGTNGHLANVICGLVQGTSTLSGGGF